MTSDWVTAIGYGFIGGFVAGMSATRLCWPRLVVKVKRVAIPTTSPPDEDDGPYRTAAPGSVALPDPIADMSRAIEDRAADANEMLRKGEITAFAFGEEIDMLARAARKLASLREAMGGVE